MKEVAEVPKRFINCSYELENATSPGDCQLPDLEIRSAVFGHRISANGPTVAVDLCPAWCPYLSGNQLFTFPMFSIHKIKCMLSVRVDRIRTGIAKRYV